MLPNFGTARSHFEELQVPEGWNPCFAMSELQVPISLYGQGKRCLCAAFLLNEWKQKDFVERAAAVLLNEPVSKCVCVEPLRTRLTRKHVG